ncbi:MAG: hypothetical protein JWQ87_1874 [Candidatus Sulfotelmatobacter sp.]|nr:hypothetical protein [Candidatus Sulfotelmatobacter sp.]
MAHMQGIIGDPQERDRLRLVLAYAIHHQMTLEDVREVLLGSPLPESCSKMDELREQRDVMLSNYHPKMEVELSKICAAIKDHQNFWHPHNC